MKPAGSPTLYPAARLRWLPLWVLAVGLLLTAALGLWSFQREAAQRSSELAREARELTQALQSQVQAYTDTLPGLRVFGLIYQTPNDAEFRSYIESISLQDRFPELALTFIGEWVEHERRAFFEAGVRADRSVNPAGHPEFRIRPPGDRPNYMVLRHNYPADAAAFGYDLFDPAQNYRPAVEQTVDSGRPVATPPLRLARDRNKPPEMGRISVVVRTALYLGGRTPETVAERRARVIGVAGVAYRIQPLMASVFQERTLKAMSVRLLDAQMSPDSPAALMFDSLPGQAVDPSKLVWQGQVAIADRQWTLLAYRRGLLAGLEGTLILMAFGSGLSLALAAITRGLARANLLAEERLSRSANELVNERDQLRRSEARFRLLFEHNFDAVLSTRPDGQVMAANRAACQLFGASEEALKQMKRSDLVDVNDERLPLLLSQREGTGRSAGQLRMRRVDGTTFEAEIASNVYPDLDGQPSTSLIIRDVTERQQLAQRLQDKQRLESIGTLAGGVAHDFNNMLAGILGNVALAEEGLPAKSAAARHLRLVRRAAERARALVRQILTFGRRAPQLQQVQPLQPLVSEALALLRASVPASVKLSVDLPDEPLLVCVDGAQVQQVVLNLCTNAWQAMHEAGGELSVRVGQRRLAPAEAHGLGLEPGEFATLEVADNGPGFDSATQARLFEPFFTTKSLGEGTGLGLAVVHGVVSESGGAIRAESTPGQGATFTVWLPLQAAQADVDVADEPVPTSPAPLDAAAPAQGLRVLYVDDDEVVALTAAALLEHAGFQVDCLEGGAPALQALQEQPHAWDVLVTDYNMPGLSGLELARAVRALNPDLPIIVISGLITEELQEATAGLGLAALLQKENMLEELGKAVERACHDAAAAGAVKSGLNMPGRQDV